MSRRVFPVLAILSSMASVPALATQGCGGDPGWASREFSGSVMAGDLYTHEAGRAAFILEPRTHGWRIGMRDADGLEMETFAPPLRPVETNPRNIAGWHFRNRANTGPNTGDVNAPQALRRFVFGTMARNLSRPAERAEGMGGLGSLTIDAFKLTEPVPGERAGFVSMDFTVCLVWQGGGDRLPPIVDAEPGVAFERVVTQMKACGLDTAVYRLSDRMSQGSERGQAPYLEPDLDGDNIPDLVVPVYRREDRAPGLAFCLIGDETLRLAGYSGRIGRHLDPAYFDSADWWSVHPKGPVWPGVAEGPPPELVGDGVTVGKEGASSVLVYLDADRQVRSYWQGD